MASLAKFAFGKISYALSDYLMNPIPLALSNQQGGTTNIVINFTKPNQINRVTQIGLIVLGNIDEPSIKQLEEDLTVAIALGNLHNLLEKNKGKDAEKFKLLENIYSDYQLNNKGIEQVGLVLAKMIHQYTHLRKEIKKTCYAKGVKWNEDWEGFQVKAKADKYKGKGHTIKYFSKGLTGKGDFIIPLEVVQIWQHVRLYPGDEAENLANELYTVFISGDESKYKSLSVDIERLISKEDKARRKGKR